MCRIFSRYLRHYNVLCNALNGIKSDIKDKITLYCAFKYTLSGIIK